MNKLRYYFIGEILDKTDDAFEHAKAILLLRFSFMFCIVFLLPIISDLILGYDKAFIIHTIAVIILFAFPFVIKFLKNTENSINLFFSISFIISGLIFMMIKPEDLNPIGISWTCFFLVLSAILQRGRMRLLFCGFLNWLPLFYVVLNHKLNGALTWNFILQEGADNPPILLSLIPMALTIYAAWANTITVEQARKTITHQKKLIDEKNKDIIDSIVYAKRIQNSLLPTNKYITKSINRLKEK